MSERATFSIRRNGSYLLHYGVSGMKKGQRRYQDESGALTAEGREHYGIKEREKKSRSTDHYSAHENGVKKYLTNEGGRYAFAKWRERRHEKNIAKAKEKGNEKKVDKYESKRKAQSAANADLQKYRDSHSSGELFLQNYLGGKSLLVGGTGHAYRHARARGSSRLASLAETYIPIAGGAMRMHRDKKKYGKYIVYSALDEKMNDVLKT